MRHIIDNFFANGEINELYIPLMEREEAAMLLHEIIVRWAKDVKIFCYQSTALSENGWLFGYHITKRCDFCLRSQKMLEKIFGDCRKLDKMPFVFKQNEENAHFFFLGDLKSHLNLK